MNIVYFLIIGLIAGWLAGKLMQGRGYGLVGNMLIGVIGSFLGGFVFGLLGLSAVTKVGFLVMATVGSMLLLFLLRQLKNHSL